MTNGIPHPTPNPAPPPLTTPGPVPPTESDMDEEGRVGDQKARVAGHLDHDLEQLEETFRQ